jgi:chemotaxis protein CheX
MICGNARRDLEAKGHLIKGAIPTVIAGKNHTVKHISNDKVVAIPFSSDAGNFVLEISFTL